jgi:hypothetical protein
MLRWLMIMLGAALCLLVGFGPYPAYVVTLDRAPSDLRVGVPFEVGFSIRASEGTEPAAALAPLVVVTNAITREELKIGALPSNAPGHYEALLILPKAGRWQWEIYPEGEASEAAVAMSPLMVGDAGEGWVQSTLMLALLALAGASAGVAVAAGRLVRRRGEVEYARQ